MNAYGLLERLLICAEAQADRLGLPFDGLTPTQKNQLKRILSGTGVLGTTQHHWPIRLEFCSLNIMEYDAKDPTPYIVVSVDGGVPRSIHPYGNKTDFDNLDPFTSYVVSGLIGEEDEEEEEEEDD